MFSSERDMEFTGARYYKINKILLDSLGLWPHRTTRCVQIRSIFFFATFVSFLFVQLCTFITSKYNMDLALKVFSHALPTAMYTLEYNAYYLNANKVKLFMEKVRNDWNKLNNKKEIKIIEKYTHTMNIYTIIFTLLTFIGIILFIFMEVLPIILDIIIPLNESRPHKLHTITEYFIDREKYFLLILLHEIIACCAGGLTILATGTVTLAYLRHICGMLKIVSFRIECILEKNVLKHSIPSLWTERIICDRIIYAVDLHRKTLKFFDMILSTFSILYSTLVIIGVASLSLNLFYFLQLLRSTDTVEFISTILLLALHFGYLFFGNYIAQIITDHCDDIFNTTCNLLWYTAPLQSQKLLLFLMHKTIKTVKPVVGKLFTGSLEDFAMFFTTSLSYLTVIYSLQY